MPTRKKRVHWSDGDTRPMPFEFVDTDELARLREIARSYENPTQPRQPTDPREQMREIAQVVGFVVVVVLAPVAICYWQTRN